MGDRGPWTQLCDVCPQVALRIRPLNDTELEEGAAVIAHKVGDQMAVLMDPSEDSEDTLRTHRSREKTFIFDVVFDQHASQEDVYCATTQHLVEGVISGYNATVFAYGPSGAGKTHTMLGMDAEPGIYLRTLTDLFRAIEEARDNMDYSVSMSYLEIYNEVIRDLLNPSSGFLDLREDSRGSIQIAGITEVSTSNAQEIMQLLTRGNRQRTQEPTATNKTSSRSHAVLQVTVRQQRRGSDLAEEVRVGRLFMVDLAGSERASQAQNRGKRMQEGAHINRSLLALGNCINALSEKGGGRAQYVNFRDSKLTRLLKDALGGNSRTVMVAHISPASTHFEESRTTLLYAYRAKNIKTRVKRNLLSVSYHIAQYTDVISNLRGKIERLKSKIERQEQEKKREPGVRDTRGTMPTQETEEDSHLQMDRIRAELVGAFKEQLEMRRSLVELENANVELHIDASRHLLAIADWEREKTQHHTQDRTPEGDEEQMVADTDMDTSKSTEPHEVALAREEVNMLLAEQRKTVALKAELEQRLACAKKKASQLEELLPAQAISEDQREVLRLLCRVHELEVENTELQASSLRRKNLLCQKDFVIQGFHQHRLLGERIIRGQRQLIQDSGIRVPAPLDECYGLYSRELGGGSLNRLLLLHSVVASSLQDGCVVNICPPPEDPSRDQPDDRKGLPWGAHFQLPPMLLEPDSEGHKSSKATPSKKPGNEDLLLRPPPLRILLTPPAQKEPSSLSLKGLFSKLGSPAGLQLGSPRQAAEALKEMAVSTKSIALIAATRRSKAQDREAGSHRSPHHPPEGRRGPSPADGGWPCTSCSRGSSVERKARMGRSPALTQSLQQGLQTAEAGATAHCPPATLVSTSLAVPRSPEDQSEDGGRWGWPQAEAGEARGRAERLTGALLGAAHPSFL
ncbi:kinesin-like protein KIF19 isoform X3 [Pteropus medius]|uniref:kinesin-like protein KIF19 isoform X3 n=1 Tax=Pteropus vampyrus TaxID=132908 RepID=UPI00196A2243|nr:kinesin-like protein KIF19 isoform X3 [Pteropus giganteus]